MISDDERREVAARLRNGGVARNSEEAYVLLLWCVGIRPQLPATSTYEDTMVRLADLIDRPRCYVVEHKTHCGSYGCEEAGQLWVLSCGDECVNDSDFPPRYCPDCGAMVFEERGCDVREL